MKKKICFMILSFLVLISFCSCSNTDKIHQVLMAALFDDVAVLHNEDDVRFADGGWTIPVIVSFSPLATSFFI